MFEATFLCTLLHFMFTLLSGRYVTSLQPFSSLVGGQRAQEMVLNWQRFGASTRPQHVCLITKTSILVWSWSHSVRTLMRNMWSCPDTLSEETQSFTPSFSPPSPYSPILSFSLSFASLSTFCHKTLGLQHFFQIVEMSNLYCILSQGIKVSFLDFFYCATILSDLL